MFHIIGYANMNTTSANTTEYACQVCKYKCHKQSNLKSHMNTRKHLNAVRESDIRGGGSESAPSRTKRERRVFSCHSCGFFTEKRADYDRHTRTQKHHQMAQHPADVGDAGDAEAAPAADPIETLTGVVIQMVKQNTEFQRVLLETQQQTQKQYAELLASYRETRPPTIQQTTNNHFNLQVFLNIQCKDAINMSDFIQGLDIQPKDIAQFGQLGFVEGITRILMEGLNGLEQHKRPIHCTDLKRDIMYIKDADRWERDNENARLLRAIESVEQTNCRLFTKTMAPAYMEGDNDTAMCEYMALLREVNGGSSREKNRAKIVKNISKACFVRGGDGVPPNSLRDA